VEYSFDTIITITLSVVG